MLSRKQTYAILATIVLCSLAASDVHSQAASPRWDYSWEISLGGGYFLPAREGFREYYRGGPEVEIGGAYKISRLVSLGIDVSYNHLWKQEEIRFTTLSFVPSIKVLFPRTLAPYFGAGLGFHRGALVFDEHTYLRSASDPDQYINASEKDFHKIGVGLRAYAGVRYLLSSKIFLGLEAKYSHTFLGDPDRGEFGNVGGLSGMLKCGMLFRG